MNRHELLAAINNAERGSLTDLGKVLRAIVNGEVTLGNGNFDTLTLGGTQVTASAAELNKLTGAGAVVASGTPVTHIADPAGGSTTDTEARAAIAEIIDALEAFGIDPGAP